MKTFSKLLLTCIFISCFFMTASYGQGSGNQFRTIKEAVNKAKSDLMTVLRLNKDIDLGVDITSLEKAQPGNAVESVLVDFDRLLKAKSFGSFDKLISSRKNTVVPLVSDGKVITIVEIGKDKKGWHVAGLGSAKITEELNTIYSTVEDRKNVRITIYDVPNLQASVYGVRSDDHEIFYTDYSDYFLLRKGVAAKHLLSQLKKDAIRFQKEYGKLLKERRLLR